MPDHPNHRYFLASKIGPLDDDPHFDWQHDLDERLTWLGHDPKLRRLQMAGDLAAWHSLGRRAAA